MVRYVVNGTAEDEALNELFHDAWPNHKWAKFGPVIESSLLHVLAYRGDTLIGFVRVVAYGIGQGMVVGPTVRTDAQRQGVGTALLNEAAAAAKERGLRRLHAEFTSRLREFYTQAGFERIEAGVRTLT